MLRQFIAEIKQLLHVFIIKWLLGPFRELRENISQIEDEAITLTACKDPLSQP